MRYELKLSNHSGKAGNLLVLQRWRGAEVTLAWMSRYAGDGETARFEWDDRDCLFTLSVMGMPSVGRRYLASTIVNCDPERENRITMSFDAKTRIPVFGALERGPAGSLTMEISPALPLNGVTAGFGMANRPAFIWQARPGTLVTMGQPVEYWAAFGSLSEGVVIGDFNALKALPLVFSADKRSISATVNAGGEWALGH